MGAFESELGVQAPVGYWDPLGLSKDGDDVKFKRRRASELKHGRICMYACLGYIVPEYFRFPGFLSVSENLTFADMPSGISGIFATPIAGACRSSSSVASSRSGCCARMAAVPPATSRTAATSAYPTQRA